MGDEDAVAARRAVRAWVRLDAAFAALNRDLRRNHGITGAQIAVLRIIGEQSNVKLSDLRHQLVMHPATLGQLVDRLTCQRLLEISAVPDDRRMRCLVLTSAGRELLANAPLAGPVRLRTEAADPSRAEALADALADAVDLFGLTPWAAE